MRGILALHLIGIFVLGIISSHSGETAIAVIDLQKAIRESDQGKVKREELEKEVTQQRERFVKRQQDLQKKMEDLQGRQAMLSPEVLAERQGEINREWEQLSREAQEANLAVQQKEMQAMEPLIDGLSKIAEAVAKEQEKTIVLERQAVVWADSTHDITDEVIKRFNKDSKGTNRRGRR